MPIHSNIKERDGRYFLRVRVPKDLVARMGKTEIVKALGTSDPLEAKRRVRPALHEWEKVFENARRKRLLSSTAIERELQAALLSGIMSAVAIRAEGKQPYRSGEPNAADPVDAMLADLAADYWQDFTADDCSKVRAEADAIIERLGVEAPPDSPAYRELCRGLLATYAEKYRVERQMRKGERAKPDLPLNPALVRPFGKSNGKWLIGDGAEGETGDLSKLSGATAQYVRAMMRDPDSAWTEQTRMQYEGTFARFAEYTGDKAVSDVKREDVAGFKGVLEQLHTSYGKSPKDHQKTLDQLIAESEGRPKLKQKTIKRHITALSAFFKWAKAEGRYTGDNPASDFKYPKARADRRARLPFTIGELNTLFHSPVYTGSHPTQRARPGPGIIRDALFWAPLIALFGGLRQEEICQLHSADVKQTKDGIWYFDVSEAEGTKGKKRVKSPAAVRHVPIHSMIIKAGLPAYLKSVRKHPSGQLFPELKRAGPDKKLAHTFAKRFTAYRRAVGLTRDRLSFHSFRHNAATALENARVPENVAVQILGHEKGSMSYNLYSVGIELPILREAVEKITYEGLDLRHLYAHQRGAIR